MKKYNIEISVLIKKFIDNLLPHLANVGSISTQVSFQDVTFTDTVPKNAVSVKTLTGMQTKPIGVTGYSPNAGGYHGENGSRRLGNEIDAYTKHQDMSSPSTDGYGTLSVAANKWTHTTKDLVSNKVTAVAESTLRSDVDSFLRNAVQPHSTTEMYPNELLIFVKACQYVVDTKVTSVISPKDDKKAYDCFIWNNSTLNAGTFRSLYYTETSDQIVTLSTLYYIKSTFDEALTTVNKRLYSSASTTSSSSSSSSCSSSCSSSSSSSCSSSSSSSSSSSCSSSSSSSSSSSIFIAYFNIGD